MSSRNLTDAPLTPQVDSASVDLPTPNLFVVFHIFFLHQQAAQRALVESLQSRFLPRAEIHFNKLQDVATPRASLPSSLSSPSHICAPIISRSR